MAGKDDNSKQIVAESIKNRTELPEKQYEHASTYKEAVNKFYDVSKSNDPANERFTNPEKSTAKNPGDKMAFEASVSAAVKVHFGDGSNQIGKGVLFYNSSSSTIYDKNKKMEKVQIDVTANGIKGAWKLKK